MRFASRLLAAAAVAALALSPVPAAAKAEYGAWGIVLSDMDPSVKPGDDFYMYVNGGWDKRVSIPADKSGFSDGDDIEERAENDLHEILEAAKSAAPGSADRKTGDFYASFMDEAAIEAKGVEPVKPLLAEIEAIKTPADLARAFGETQRGFGISPIFIYIEPDSKKPAQYAAYFYQSGLGLPDRDYYLKDTPENLKYREAYRAYIAQLLTLAGVADPAAKAESIFALETEIAKIHWPAEETRDTLKTYNPITPSALNTEAPGLDWTTFLVAGGLSNAPQLVMGEKTAIIGLAALVGATPIETWKAYLTFHTLDQAAQYLPKAFDQAYFDFNMKTMGGQETQRDRWKRAVWLIDRYMGEALGEAYVARRFTPEAKAMMTDMVANLKAALGQMIDEAKWLDPATKTEAHTKLDAMGVMIGYPDAWRDYSALEVKADDALGNVLRAAAFDWKRQTDRIAGPVDKTEWGMTPPTVNAYNWFNKNQIVFPAGILQPPYFDVNADMAVNYGSMGATIGHEISHGFDDQGRKYDATGAIRDWWTEKDAAAYEIEARKMVAQFDAFEPLPGVHINGELTLGENIADLAGLAIAYRAYHLALGGTEAPVLDGMTGDQRFFLGYAMSWRSKTRDDRLRARLASDPHSPAYYRVNGIVRNFGPWYDAFGVPADAKLMLPADQRATFW